MSCGSALALISGGAILLEGATLELTGPTLYANEGAGDKTGTSGGIYNSGGGNGGSSSTSSSDAGGNGGDCHGGSSAGGGGYGRVTMLDG